jgi:hypothetical protein
MEKKEMFVISSSGFTHKNPCHVKILNVEWVERMIKYSCG